MKQIRVTVAPNVTTSTKCYWLATLFFALSLAPCRSAETAPARVSAAEFDRWISDISNWGRWGKEDELGTLNLITAVKRKAASRLVRVGVSVSLALDLNKLKEGMNFNPFIHELTTAVWGGHEVAGDTYSVEYHGFAHSDMDALAHFAHNGQMYNGVSVDTLKKRCAEKLGIQNARLGMPSFS